VSSSDERRPLLKQQAVGLHVRELRTAAGMSLRGLAERTDFSPSFISQVENGQVSPSIASMERIAGALGVTLGEFFAAASRGAAGTIVRAADRTVLASSWSAASVAALSSMSGHRDLEPVLITLEPGGRSGKHPAPHATEEFAFVLEGEVTVTLGFERHRLCAGDAATILPRELRLWENAGTRPARVLVVSAVGRG
jgi:transcriptional regulator with XRE-family HTH domain